MSTVIIFTSFFLIVIGVTTWVLTYEKLQNKKLDSIKHSNHFIELFSSDDLEIFFNIPEEYRCNPFLYDSEGKLFYADKRNIDKAMNYIKC